jgi:AcrR family transcriptional regulator
VRRHGWGGRPPTDETEARQRIIEAAMRCVDRHGPDQFTIAQVAADLEVIRQTVYRYFPSTDDLFAAVGQYAVEDFIDELAAHLHDVTDPADWFVEALATAIERLPDRPYLTLLLASGRTEPFARGVTSPEAMAVGREVVKRAPIDWPARGYDSKEIDELIELMLRILQSMTIDPHTPPRTPRQLRRFLRRWLAPALS